MSKSMDLKTFMPMMSRDFIGKFKTSSSDLSDLSVSLLYRFNQMYEFKVAFMKHFFQQSIGENIKGHSANPNEPKDEHDLALWDADHSGDDATSVILRTNQCQNI